MLRSLFHLLGNSVALLAAFGLLARFVPPDVLWPPAIVALLLPGLLLATLLFTIIVLYQRRWKAAVVPVLVLLVSLPMVGRLFSLGTGSGAQAEANPRLVIGTVNARGFKNAAWKNVAEQQVVDFLHKLDAEILLIQEAGAGAQRNNLIKKAGAFATYLQPQKRTVATYADNLHEVAAKFEGYNGFTVADVKTSLGTIRFINAHIQSNRISKMAGEIGQEGSMQEGIDRAESMFRNYGASARTRAKQAAAIRQYINQSPHPVVVGGDFNDVPSSYTYQRVRTPRLRDAWTEQGFGLGTTFTGPLPGLRIDYLLVDTSLTVVSVDRLETGFSDHRALKIVVE
ncbi:MAG: endonuclease/exonuclease/phosphatase family protein [Bacteroidota bacterium]